MWWLTEVTPSWRTRATAWLLFQLIYIYIYFHTSVVFFSSKISSKLKQMLLKKDIFHINHIAKNKIRKTKAITQISRLASASWLVTKKNGRPAQKTILFSFVLPLEINYGSRMIVLSIIHKAFNGENPKSVTEQPNQEKRYPQFRKLVGYIWNNSANNVCSGRKFSCIINTVIPRELR